MMMMMMFLPTNSVLLHARKQLAWRAAFGSSINFVVDLCLHSLEVSLLTRLCYNTMMPTSRRPCSDFTDMLWRLTNCRIIIIYY